LKNRTDDENFCNASIHFINNLLLLLFELNKEEILSCVKENGFFIPTAAQRKKLYGNIKVDEKILDYQYSPNW
jgi:hypothetical protein